MGRSLKSKITVLLEGFKLNSEFSSARQRVSESELVCLSHVISNRHMSPAPPIISALTNHHPPVSIKYATFYQLFLIYLEILID